MEAIPHCPHYIVVVNHIEAAAVTQHLVCFPSMLLSTSKCSDFAGARAGWPTYILAGLIFDVAILTWRGWPSVKSVDCTQERCKVMLSTFVRLLRMQVTKIWSVPVSTCCFITKIQVESRP